MKTVTFAFDCQLNNQEDFIKEGSVVEVSDNEFYIHRYENSIPVIITEGYNCKGKKIAFEPYVEWFMKESFVGV